MCGVSPHSSKNIQTIHGGKMLDAPSSLCGETPPKRCGCFSCGLDTPSSLCGETPHLLPFLIVQPD